MNGDQVHGFIQVGEALIDIGSIAAVTRHTQSGWSVVTLKYGSGEVAVAQSAVKLISRLAELTIAPEERTA